PVLNSAVYLFSVCYINGSSYRIDGRRKTASSMDRRVEVCKCSNDDSGNHLNHEGKKMNRRLSNKVSNIVIAAERGSGIISSINWVRL
ncbi:hypothetical protein L9F63_026446, partial [Diploptera punctata]